jgi:hypothetical protein
MTPKDAARELELVARDLDLVVFRLERDAPAGVEGAREERGRVRRELEGLRERIESLARALD